jgi:hypothetical protein
MFFIFSTLHAVWVGDGEFRCCMAVVLAGLGFHGLILPVLHLQMMTLHQTELALLLSNLHKAIVPSLYCLAIGFTTTAGIFVLLLVVIMNDPNIDITREVEAMWDMLSSVVADFGMEGLNVLQDWIHVQFAH